MHISVPHLSNAKKPTKDLIISTLTFEHPLTLTKICSKIKSNFAVEVTFPGVRKAVLLLVEEGVLEKRGKNYQLNKEWITKLRDFAHILQDAYYKEKTGYKDIQSIGDEVKVYTFDNLLKLDEFINSFLQKWFEESPGGEYVQQAGHAYWVVGHLEEEAIILEKAGKKKVKFFTLIGGNTRLDRRSIHYYENQGESCIINAGNTNRYFGVYKDYFFQYETPSQLTAELDHIYSAAENFDSLDFAALITALRRNVDIRITVMKNRIIAEQLRSTILSHFKQK